MARNKIFISYRRDDASGDARSIYQRLERRFGRGRLFIDVETIRPGKDFRKVLDESLSSTRAMLVLIGPRWNEGDRLSNPEDFVRLEIKHALESDIDVLPVLLENTTMPAADTLPEDMRDLVFRQGLKVRHDSFGADMGAVERALQQTNGGGDGWVRALWVLTGLGVSGAAKEASPTEEETRRAAAEARWRALEQSDDAVELAAFIASDPTSRVAEAARARLTAVYKDAQRELKRLGDYQGAIDGVWGPASEEALTTWRRAAKRAGTDTAPTAAELAALKQAMPVRREPTEIAVLRGHTRYVFSAAFSRDGTRLATASSDKTARLWDAETGAEIAVLRGHSDDVNSAAFSSDGTRLATASDDKTARLWDAETGAEIAVLRGHTNWVRSAAFSPDGSRLATASWDNTARLWDAETGAAIAVLRGHSDDVNSAVFSPDGTRLATASDDKTARLWDAETGAEIAVLRGHARSVLSAAFSPDGTRLATASFDNTARLWDVETGAEIAVLRGDSGPVTSAAFSPDGTRLATASYDNTARLWDAETGAEIAVLRGHSRDVNSAAFNPDGTRLATASDDKTARLWDVETGAEITVLRGHTDWVRAAVFSPDGTRLVTASGDGTARVWQVRAESP